MLVQAGDFVTLFFNPLDESYLPDPWVHLKEMRDGEPVHLNLTGDWMLFSYEDIFRLLRDPALSVDIRTLDTSRDRTDRFAEAMVARGHKPEPSNSILNNDPPKHTRLRRLVSKAFTPRTIENLRPMIQSMVDDVLDGFAEAGEADVVDGLAFPLPFDVIIEMLGMPASEGAEVRGWSEALVKTLDPMVSDEILEEAADASIAMNSYISGVIDWKRSNPGDDLLTKMIDAEEDGDRMSTAELRDQVTLLFVAGHETTVNLIGTGIFELLRHPEQMRRWIEDPELATTAVDELLRYISPVQFSRRITTGDLTIDGTDIGGGEFVLASLASANRDPAHWGETANVLDLGRENAGQHVAFGSGAHYCLGASLAKLEAQIAIGSFIARFPDAAVLNHEWNGRINLRGLSKLRVSL